MTKAILIPNDKRNRTSGRTVFAVAIGLLASACTSTNPKVLEAEASVEQLRADPAIEANAPVALQRTEEALERLNAAAGNGAGQEEVDHLAYLVERRADATELRAETVSNWRAVDQLGERREQILLQAQTLKADVARREAASAIKEASDAKARAESLEQELEDLEARHTDRGLVVTLGDLLFDVDGTDLQPGGLAEVRRVADTLVDFPDRKVTIEGHTDNTGPETYNLKLSQDRAEAVKRALIDAGVPENQIASRGYGESYPVVTNDTQAGRQQNRRVELIIQDS
jgi:outer membrane protein OmpA-like peptidoglycan-associated protein